MSEPTHSEGELFELELIGGSTERRYRRMRPEVEDMPWASLDATHFPDHVLVAARAGWTRAAFQEHRTGVACTATLRALVEAAAPLDLIALATRFPLDEMVHVELCARMAMLLGGGTEVRHNPDGLIRDADANLPTLVRCADMVVRFFCVGEALSIPLLRGGRNVVTHPLPKAILSRIVRDEAAHGAFGFTFLDWALPLLEPDEIAHLGAAADRAIAAIHDLWSRLRSQPPRDYEPAIDPFSWAHSDDYLHLAAVSMQRNVVEPLTARGIPLGMAEVATGGEQAVGLVGQPPESL